MKFIDPHIHMYARTTDDYENMKKVGYVAVIEPAFWSGTDKTCACSHYDYFDHLLNFEHDRAEKYGIKHYSFLGINPKEAKNTKISFEVIYNLNKYLEHPNCLGIGEIGFDLITNDEEDILRRQIIIAEKTNSLVIIHLPHNNKLEGVKRTFKVLDQENVNFKKYIIDHNTDNTIEIVLDHSEIIAGITLYPNKVSNENAAMIINRYNNNTDRILINSSADWGKSYPLNVSEASKKFHQLGLNIDWIKKVSYENAFKFFSQSPKFKLDN